MEEPVPAKPVEKKDPPREEVRCPPNGLVSSDEAHGQSMNIPIAGLGVLVFKDGIFCGMV